MWSEGTGVRAVMSENEKREKNTDTRHTWLFLLETTIALTIFALAAAVMLSVFVVSSKNQQEAEAIHISNTKLQNVVEVIRSAISMDDLNQLLVSEYGVDGNLEAMPTSSSSGTDSTVTIYLDEDYVVVLSCDGADAGLYHFHASLEKKDEVIEEIDVDHYMKEASHAKE
jgi:hypothetical protein